jgi:predicted CopG family antitoxin
MKKNPQKMILVDDTLHRELLVMKSMGSFKSLSDVIRHLVTKNKL